MMYILLMKYDTYLQMVLAANNNIVALTKKRLETKDDDSVPMEDWLMISKVQKHYEGNTRKAAAYIAMRLNEFSSPLSEWAKEHLKKCPKIRPASGQIQYLNDAGEWRAFEVNRPS